jgi:hypothetical protein
VLNTAGNVCKQRGCVVYIRGRDSNQEKGSQKQHYEIRKFSFQRALRSYRISIMQIGKKIKATAFAKTGYFFGLLTESPDTCWVRGTPLRF